MARSATPLPFGGPTNGDAPMVGFLLEVFCHVIGAVVVPQGQALGHAGVDAAKIL